MDDNTPNSAASLGPSAPQEGEGAVHGAQPSGGLTQSGPAPNPISEHVASQAASDQADVTPPSSVEPAQPVQTAAQATPNAPPATWSSSLGQMTPVVAPSAPIASTTAAQPAQPATIVQPSPSGAVSVQPKQAGASGARNAPPTPGQTARKAKVVAAVTAVVVVLACIGGGVLALKAQADQKSKAANDISNYKVATVGLTDLSKAGILNADASSQLTINGQLRINNSFVLTPTDTPADPLLGQFYLDRTNTQLYYYNGAKFVSLATGDQVTTLNTQLNYLGNKVNSLNGQLPTAGTGLRQNGTKIDNAGVLSLQGQTGALTLTAGGGIGLNGLAISNTGVTGLNGTANQINVSQANGNVTLSLAQDIAPTSIPTFGGLKITDGTGTFAYQFSGVATTSNKTINIPTFTGASADLCLTSGNCAGAGTGVTAVGGSSGYLALFTGSQQITSSILSQNGAATAITIGGDLAVGGTASGNGSGLTNVNAAQLGGQNGSYYQNASNLNAGTIADARLSTNVSLLNASQSFTGVNTFSNSANSFTGTYMGDGALLNNLNASNVTSGTLAVAQGGTGAGTAIGARVNLSAAKSGANSDITSLSGLTTSLSVLQGGTGQSSFTLNGVLVGNGSGALQVTSAGGSGQCLVSNGATAPTFQSCTGGSGGNAADRSLSNLQNVAINTTLLPASFGTIDLGSNQFPFQGLYLSDANQAFAYHLTGAATTANKSINIPDFAGTIANLCLSIGNCAGSGTGVTASGSSASYIPLFSSSQNITNSILSQDAGATTLTVGGTTGNLVINGVVSGNGSGLTALNGSNIASGTVADTRLSANVALLDAVQSFTGINTFSNASNSFSGNGSGLTSLNATNIASGTVNDGRLSSNVALLNRNSQTFTGNNQEFQNASDSTTAFQIQNAAGTSSLFVADTLNKKIGIGTAPSTTGGTLQVTQDAGAGPLIGLHNMSTTDGRSVISFTSDRGINSGHTWYLGQNPTGGTGIFGLRYDSNAVLPLSVATSGASTFQNIADSTTAFQIQNAAGTSKLFNADTTNSRIGIGTAAPAYALDISAGTGIVGQFSGRVIGGNAVNSNEFVTKSQLDGVTTGTAGAFIQGGNSFGVLASLGTNDNFGLALKTNNAERLRIDSSGNVGIGTTAPSSLLQLGSDAGTAASGIKFGSTGDTSLYRSAAGVLRSGGQIQGTSFRSDGNLYVNYNNSPGANGIYFGSALDTNLYRSAASNLTTDGSLTLGGTSLTIAGSSAQINATGGALTIKSSSANPQILFSGAASEYGRFNSSGNFVLAPTGQLGWGASVGSVDTNLYRSAASTLKTDSALIVQNTIATNTLGSAGSTALCYNASNQIATCSGSGGSAPTTLQQAYVNGNTINTTDARDINFTLADTTTDSNFLVNVATNSTSKFAVQKNGVDTFSVDSTGKALHKNTVDSTTAFQIQNAAGTALFTADTTNGAVGIGTAPVTTAGLKVAKTFSGVDQANAAVFAAIHTVATSGTVYGTQTSATLSNSTGTQGAAQASINQISYGGTQSANTNVAISSAQASFNRLQLSGTNPVGTINSVDAVSAGTPANFSTTADVIVGSARGVRIQNQGAFNGTGGGSAIVQNAYGLYIDAQSGASIANYAIFAQGAGGNPILSVNGTGQTAYRNSTDSTTAFQIQNVAGTSSLFNADTINGRIGIGTTTPTQKLDVYAGNLSLSTVAAPTAPTLALSGTAGNVDNGLHYYAITYVNAAGETTLGTAASTTVVDNTTSGQVNLTAIPTAAANAGVTARKIYRTTAGAGNSYANYKLVTTINDNTTTTYTDNTADVSLTGGHSGNNTAGGFLTNGSTKFGFAGADNTFFGLNALQSNTTGFNNTATGALALQINTTGLNNTATGTIALQGNTTGSNNTATGYGALYSNTTGINNSGYGVNALYGNTTGNFNVGLGRNAGYSTVAINANTTGSLNTFIGYGSGPGTATQLQNASAIGTNSVVSQNDSLVLGCINGINGCTASTKIGIGTATPAYTLDVAGNVNASTQIYVNGVAVCTVNTCAAGSGTGNYIQNGTTPQTANFNITGNGTVGGGLSVAGATSLGGTVGLPGNASVILNTTVGGTLTVTSTNGVNNNLVIDDTGGGSYGTFQMKKAGTVINQISAGNLSGPTFFNGSNYVGIGTATPQNNLEVRSKSNGVGNGGIRISASDAPTNGGYLILNQNSSAGGAYGSIQSGDGFTFRVLSLNQNGGNVCIHLTTCNNALGISGTGAATGGFITSASPDIAETIPAAGDVQAYDVVTADPNGDTRAIRSAKAYDSTTIGVIADGSSSFRINSNAHENIDSLTGKYLVLAGRVPVHVTNEGGAIAPGDYLTTSSTPGYAMKATHAGPTIGKALAAFTGTSGTVMTQTNLSYYDPASGQAAQGSSADLSSLNVSGATTLASLVVEGSATFKGDITVSGNASFNGNIMVNGHIVTGGNQPIVEVQAQSGTGATATVTGNDSLGTISIKAGQNATKGDLVKLIFSKTYSNPPKVIISASNDDAAGLRFLRGTTTNTDVMLRSIDTPTAGATYQYDYFVAQ